MTMRVKAIFDQYQGQEIGVFSCDYEVISSGQFYFYGPKAAKREHLKAIAEDIAYDSAEEAQEQETHVSWSPANLDDFLDDEEIAASEEAGLPWRGEDLRAVLTEYRGDLLSWKRDQEHLKKQMKMF